MARGDVRPTKSNHGRGHYGGSRTYYHDDEGRGKSKQVWDWFESNFNAHPTLEWLLSLEDKTYYWLLKGSRVRFGLMDIVYYTEPGWNAYSDTRAHRLVIKKLNEASWVKFYNRLMVSVKAEEERVEKQEHEAATEREGRYAAYEAQRKAEQAIVDRNDLEQLQATTQLTIGMFENELNTTFVPNDCIGDNGDWIELASDTYINGSGFGYEEKKATGIKLQITVSLDLSNSMVYNGIATTAAVAFRDICWTLKALKSEHEGDLFTGFFTFSDDAGYNEPKYYGQRASLLKEIEYHTPKNLGEVQFLAPSVLKSVNINSVFQGHDTHIRPLLLEIENWENHNSDAGAVRLDIIITDAVLEHPKDIREADVVQERRNGSLQTVLLNFMPESEWLNSTLPKRCYMLKVDKDNIAGILRNVLSEFVGAHM